MSYYAGTKQECEEYNTTVTSGEGYSGSTSRWGKIEEHQNGLEFAIIAHENYPSTMVQIDALPSDWRPELNP